MTAMQIRERFEAAIDARGADDQYIDRNEEREILQIAIQLGLPTESARTTLAEVCQARGYVVETAVAKSIATKLTAADRLDRVGFESLVGEAKQGGLRTERQAKTLVLEVIEDLGTVRLKTGWLRNWYAVAKRDVGM